MIPCRSPWQHSRKWRQTRPGVARLFAYAHRGLARLTQAFVPIDELYPWSIAATNPGISIVQKHGIDLIWATSPPVSAHWLARRIGLRTDVPYIIDYRDVPIPSGNYNNTHKIYKIHRQLIEDATGITFTAPTQIDLLRRWHPLVDNIQHRLVYNGFDLKEMATCNTSNFERPSILYGGTFYGGIRRVDSLIKSLDTLRNRQDSMGPDIQFVVFLESHGDMNYLGKILKDHNLRKRKYRGGCAFP